MKVRWRRHPSGHDITCRRAVSLVASYLDGALRPDERDRFEAHMDECPHCREHLKQIEVTILIAGQVRADDLDPLAREDLMDLYRRWRDDSAAS